MGTIAIEEYQASGHKGNRTAPIMDLSTLLARTDDATTSTSAESVTLNDGTRFVSVYAVEKHRISLGTDTTGTNYAVILAGETKKFAVKEGQTLYYRADA